MINPTMVPYQKKEKKKKPLAWYYLGLFDNSIKRATKVKPPFLKDKKVSLKTL